MSFSLYAGSMVTLWVVLARETFVLLVTSARAGRLFVNRVLTTFLFGIESSEFLDDDEDEGKRRLRVHILRLIKP